jgi:hypothetical protein
MADAPGGGNECWIKSAEDASGGGYVSTRFVLQQNLCAAWCKCEEVIVFRGGSDVSLNAAFLVNTFSLSEVSLKSL